VTNDPVFARRLQEHSNRLDVEFTSLMNTLKRAGLKQWAKHFYHKNYHARQSLAVLIRSMDPDNPFSLPIDPRLRKPKSIHITTQVEQIPLPIQTLTPEELVERDERAAQIRRKLGLNTD
jgi:hypothetical protein